MIVFGSVFDEFVTVPSGVCSECIIPDRAQLAVASEYRLEYDGG